jgi:hypothetical protein
MFVHLAFTATLHLSKNGFNRYSLDRAFLYRHGHKNGGRISSMGLVMAFVIERIAQLLTKSQMTGSNPVNLKRFSCLGPFLADLLPPVRPCGRYFSYTTHKPTPLIFPK